MECEVVSSKKTILIHHYVIKYSDLNSEIGMTSDADKMNDKDDIVSNEND